MLQLWVKNEEKKYSSDCQKWKRMSSGNIGFTSHFKSSFALSQNFDIFPVLSVAVLSNPESHSRLNASIMYWHPKDTLRNIPTKLAPLFFFFFFIFFFFLVLPLTEFYPCRRWCISPGEKYPSVMKYRSWIFYGYENLLLVIRLVTVPRRELLLGMQYFCSLEL